MDDFVCKVCGCTEYYESKEDGGKRIRKRCKRCQQERMRKIYATQAYKDKHRDDDRRRRRYCSPSTYISAVEKQEGKCAICGIQLWNKLLADHSHVKKKFRGLLCLRCNTGLGNFQDNIEYLEKAIEYLKRNDLE